MNKIGKVFIFLFIIWGILCISNDVQAGDLNLNDLRYNIQLNSDGSMDVVETWNIYIEDTNTLFKTFDMNGLEENIVSVEVYEVNTDGSKKLFNKINEEMYHVTKGSYYALINHYDEFEIAWGVSVINETKQYELHYKVLDCIKSYNDCSEIYWQLISDESSISADKVTGIIKLPTEVNEITDLRAWGHGPINGNIAIESKDTVSFDIEYLDAYNLLEFRIAVLDKNVFSGASIVNEDRFDFIIAEEEVFADEANAEREKYIEMLSDGEDGAQQEKNTTILNTLSGVICVLVAFMLIKFWKYSKLINNTPKPSPTEIFDYYRDIPNSDATPAEAGYLYYFKKNSMGVNISKILSATILDLALKKYIEFSVENSKRKEQIRITITEDNGKREELKEDENMIYELLRDVASKHNGSFTIKEFEKYAKSHYQSFLKKVDSLGEKAEKELEKRKLYNKELVKASNKWQIYSVLYFIFGFTISVVGFMSEYPLAMQLSAGLLVMMIVLMVSCGIIYRRTRVLTQEGIDEAEKWNGLKRFMEDFSMLDEREVPELVLWEKYLVFATAFGIADKVLKQLKITYPELVNADYVYMPLIYSNSFNSGFLTQLDKSVNGVYNAGVSERAMHSGYSGGNYSSGGGFGGGFSGGGGGFGGGSMGGR